ncbi:hypothetical protein ZIOFF_037040 [Zingiber officinale]|uniref:Uncharacterized protein n=1 Tax=Zingiber officinale TaxID=94328 RepID=A0A8J5GI34_ZINOF|nr:hypothetical protein ZIOFF_037040 [Zingiber officinale]
MRCRIKFPLAPTHAVIYDAIELTVRYRLEMEMEMEMEMETESAWEEELFFDELDVDDDERLGSVIRSLEAEISSAAGLGGEEDLMAEQYSVHDREECEDCRMDDVLSGVGSFSTAYLAEAPAGGESPCGGGDGDDDDDDDMVNWYVDELFEEGARIWSRGRTGCSVNGCQWDRDSCTEQYYCSLCE